MIQTHQLTKRFNRHTAVENLEFSVEPGEIVGFLGPNGAGKTTTMRMLTGYLPPTSGSVQIDGIDVFRNSLKARKKIGYMPENVPLYNDMRVREYLRYRAKLKGLRYGELRRRVDHVIHTCGLESVKRRMIRVLSKGYRQRVGLADTLVHRPDLLILDEPTNGLDPIQIRQIRELIGNLGNSHTILLSTHILSEVEMTCKRVIIIDQGHICAQGTPTELTKNMRAAGKIITEISGDPEPVSAALSELEYVRRISLIPNENEEENSPWHQFEILVDSGTDARERINRLAAANGWPLRTLYRRRPTLEDVFVELTRKD